MGLNAQPSGERVHIGFFGLRNAGKSSVVNRVTGQTLSIVSDVKGTTTDPVQKAMELLPIGPVVIIDTPGIDDEGTLGEERVRRALRVLEKTDIAVLVTDSTRGLQPAEQELIELFRKREIPFVIAHNKADLTSVPAAMPENEIYVSAAADSNIRELKELIARAVKPTEPEKRLVADLLAPNDTVVLVVPIDSAAPKGRLILPQQQTIRDILEAGAISLVTRETELTRTQGFQRAGQLGFAGGYHGLAGVRHCGQAGAEKCPADLVLHPVCPIQRQSAAGDSRCCTAEFFAGWRYCAHLRRLHASPPVRRYRHGKTAELDSQIYRQRCAVLVYRG